MKVWTTHGLVDRDSLTVKDIVTEDDNSRCIATEWHLGEELVRRDAYVNFLRPQSTAAEQGAM